MHYAIAAKTDAGTVKQTNQDSVLVKHGKCARGEVVLAAICDGMGGLERGELASAAVVREFARWFDEELPFELQAVDMRVIGGKWSLLLKDLNVKIAQFGQRGGSRMGTTFTGILMIGDEYTAVHVGDSRLYYLGSSIRQMTKDHTFVAREVSRGTLTLQQAKTDKRRNLLLQCVGASETIEPDVFTGKVERGVYMLCSDGFRHEISSEEVYEFLHPGNFPDRSAMERSMEFLIEQVKLRGEKDNISVILVKAD